jgi:hypothetical protein
MQIPANNPKSHINRLNWQTSLPPVTYSLPIWIAGLFIAVYGASTPGFRSAVIDLMWVLYLFWLLCLWQIHRVLEQETRGAYPAKPNRVLFLSIVAGPPAPAIAAFACEQSLKLLAWLTELISEVLPNALPIVNSATNLMEIYGTLLAIAVAVGAAVSCQWQWWLSLAEFFAKQGQQLAPQRAMLSAAVIGIALAAPGSLSLLGTNGYAWQITGSPEWNERLIFIDYTCCLLAFLPLLWLNRRLTKLL